MLKLHAGVSKKVGLPDFSSASASYTIEDELCIRSASRLIDEPKSDEPTTAGSNGNGAFLP